MTGGLGVTQTGMAGDSPWLLSQMGRCWGEGDVLEPSNLGVQGNKSGVNLQQRGAGEDGRNPESLVTSALTGSIVCPGTHPPCGFWGARGSLSHPAPPGWDLGCGREERHSSRSHTRGRGSSYGLLWSSAPLESPLLCVCRAPGKAYSLGRAEYGRLGLGAGAEEKSTPTVIPELPSISSVACGASVGYAVSSDGECRRPPWAWECHPVYLPHPSSLHPGPPGSIWPHTASSHAAGWVGTGARSWH